MATDVGTIIANQQAYAETWRAQAQAFIDQVATLSNVSFDVIVPASLGFGRSGITDTAQAAFAAQRPTRPTIPTISATAPDAPAFSFSAIVPVEVLDFVGSAPVLDFPTPPSAALPSVPSAPSIEDPVFPDAPVVAIPDTPSLTVPALPTPPSIELPYFGTTLPVDDLVIPTYTFSFAEQEYTSALLDEVKAKLLDDLVNGTYGIDPSDEQALWERARARETSGAAQAIDELIQFHAARGFALPPGDLTVAFERAQQALVDKTSSVNRDIALKRADLFVAARQFAIEQSREMETVLINLHNSIMERALNAAKATLDASIQIFNATVSRYNARLAAYQAEAQVFELKIRAALSQLEIYRAQVDAARLSIEVQKLAIDAYNAQLSGIQAVVGIYRTRMEAASIQATVQRTRLEMFRGLVDAYAQQVQAKVAEFSLYRARIEGETAKVTAFEAQVHAYTAQLAGAKTKADVQVANLQAEVQQANTRLAAYQATIEQFKADLQSQTTNLTAVLDTYKADITAFQVGVEALKSAYSLEIEELRASEEWNVKVVDAALAKATLLFRAHESEATLRLGAAEFGSKVYSASQQAVLNSITTLAASITNS